jgi:hypothetical protein
VSAESTQETAKEIAADEPQQGIGADRHTAPAGRPRPGLAAQGEGDGGEGRLLTVGASRVCPRDPRQALGEDRARASGVGAEELPDPDLDADGDIGPW